MNRNFVNDTKLPNKLLNKTRVICSVILSAGLPNNTQFICF